MKFFNLISVLNYFYTGFFWLARKCFWRIPKLNLRRCLGSPLILWVLLFGFSGFVRGLIFEFSNLNSILFATPFFGNSHHLVSPIVQVSIVIGVLYVSSRLILDLKHYRDFVEHTSDEAFKNPTAKNLMVMLQFLPASMAITILGSNWISLSGWLLSGIAIREYHQAYDLDRLHQEMIIKKKNKI